MLALEKQQKNLFFKDKSLLLTHIFITNDEN